ncbi:hypothetical protein NT04LM_2765, partial [Listeria monocytogenes FSL F2-208]
MFHLFSSFVSTINSIPPTGILCKSLIFTNDKKSHKQI